MPMPRAPSESVARFHDGGANFAGRQNHIGALVRLGQDGPMKIAAEAAQLQRRISLLQGAEAVVLVPMGLIFGEPMVAGFAAWRSISAFRQAPSRTAYADR